jgi:hypothetical protein
MDDVVRQAIAKWPNVPHCFGWLKLDARGHWRMRDERAQQLDLPGDKIAHPALLGFINRNYTHDEEGRWYFQNGPQRVYVDLEFTPHIVRTDPVAGFIIQTGAALDAISQIWMTQEGQLVLASETLVAGLDDRDAAAVLATLTVARRAASDEEIMEWLEGSDEVALIFPHGGSERPLQRIRADELAAKFGFVLHPRATA